MSFCHSNMTSLIFGYGGFQSKCTFGFQCIARKMRNTEVSKQVKASYELVQQRFRPSAVLEIWRVALTRPLRGATVIGRPFLLLAVQGAYRVHCENDNKKPSKDDDCDKKKQADCHANVEVGILFILLLICDYFITLIRFLLRQLFRLKAEGEKLNQTWDQAKAIRNSSVEDVKSNDPQEPGESFRTIQKGSEVIKKDFFGSLQKIYEDLTSWLH